MTPEEDARIGALRIMGFVSLAASVGGGLLGHHLAAKHKLLGTIVGAILTPAIVAPATVLILVPAQLPQATVKR